MIDDVRSRMAGIEAKIGIRSSAPPVSTSATGNVGGFDLASSRSLVSAGAQSSHGTLGAMWASALEHAVPGAQSTPSYGTSGPVTPYTGDVPAAAGQFRAAFEAAAQRYGVDPDLLAAVAWTESNFNADARSHAGALGLMQIMPGTASDLGVDPRDPVQAIDGAARYLRQQLDRFGDVRLALAAYNAGPGAVQQHGGIPPYDETVAYVPKVLARYETLRSSS